ncbi:sialate O-acetylesterase [Siphonobacter curvatus]|uniref:Sialate O-acetylesterase n=1 Tax=Siphonobacter curvatus TaxID=2094562 RepID=A0A2S7II38_9BACT|nr:sialate O-acetylesterase [Siphonobacter curvatus]PQA55622.1 sialate O-acetylesterase [Siphonobacter curvatus]
MKKLLLCLLGLVSLSVSGQVRLARLFADHVVLQRQKPIPVWGWAQPKEKVTVVLAGRTQTAKADAQGKWMVRFPAMEAGGPYELRVFAKSGNTSISDVLLGEVWLCSGQSNMEWAVDRAQQFETERKDANYPQIRQFRVANELDLRPHPDLETGEWQVCSPQTVGGFTAVGFFFAREVYQKLNVPIGLLHSSWGGSDIEGWISKEALLSDPELRENAQRLPATWAEADSMSERNFRQKFYGRATYVPTAADEQKFLSSDVDFSKWVPLYDPIGQWYYRGLFAFKGNGYMGRIVQIPAAMASQPTTLVLADNDSPTDVYLNGKKIAEGVVKGIREIKLPAHTWKSGANQLVMKLQKRTNPEWFGLGLLGSLQHLYVASETDKISLVTDWKIMPSLAEPHGFVPMLNRLPTTLYNTKLAPLIPFGIRGVLWYQGENNADRAYQYRRSFPLLINDWRQGWSETLPFYFVQLSSFGTDQSSNQGSAWAELREAQTMTLQLPKTGMAVTTDIGNATDIHPTNKQDVGHRLAIQALHFEYGQPMAYSSPLLDTVHFQGSKAVLRFKFAEHGLIVKDKYGYVKGFEIAGADRVFHYAQAQIKGNTIEVSHPSVLQPQAVRYAWSDAPIEANVFNTEGLPLNSFRTDQWPGVTEKRKYER